MRMLLFIVRLRMVVPALVVRLSSILAILKIYQSFIYHKRYGPASLGALRLVATVVIPLIATLIVEVIPFSRVVASRLALIGIELLSLV